MAVETKPTLHFELLEVGELPGQGILRQSVRLYRAKVPGGWLVLYEGAGPNLCFVPDPEHRWDGASLK